MEQEKIQFASRGEFHALLLQCVERSQRTLQLFDPDFSAWPLAGADGAQRLRAFLLANAKARLELAMHNPSHLQRHCPRLLRLLADFSHQIECRTTPKPLRQLTDSFCLGDGKHLVRRFHCDHFRGEAGFDAPPLAQPGADRFAAIWDACEPGLHATALGL